MEELTDLATAVGNGIMAVINPGCRGNLKKKR